VTIKKNCGPAGMGVRHSVWRRLASVSRVGRSMLARVCRACRTDKPLEAISAQGRGERHSRIWTCKSSSSTAASKRNS
jgi:hypothetical protein